MIRWQEKGDLEQRECVVLLLLFWKLLVTSVKERGRDERVENTVDC